jgi:hypothetical protein
MSLQSFFRAVGRVVWPRDARIAIAGILAIVLLVLQTGIGRAAFQAAGLSRPTPSFVELYFPDARALPSSLPASDHLELRFALNNVGMTTHSFTWQVSDNTGKVTLRLVSGRSAVSANGTDVVVRNIRVDCSGKRAELLVSVERTSARISLWLACPSHT